MSVIIWATGGPLSRCLHKQAQTAHFNNTRNNKMNENIQVKVDVWRTVGRNSPAKGKPNKSQLVPARCFRNSSHVAGKYGGAVMVTVTDTKTHTRTSGVAYASLSDEFDYHHGKELAIARLCRVSCYEVEDVRRIIRKGWAENQVKFNTKKVVIE